MKKTTVLLLLALLAAHALAATVRSFSLAKQPHKSSKHAAQLVKISKQHAMLLQSAQEDPESLAASPPPTPTYSEKLYEFAS